MRGHIDQLMSMCIRERRGAGNWGMAETGIARWHIQTLFTTLCVLGLWKLEEEACMWSNCCFALSVYSGFSCVSDEALVFCEPQGLKDRVLSADLCGGDTPLVNDTKVNALPWDPARCTSSLKSWCSPECSETPADSFVFLSPHNHIVSTGQTGSEMYFYSSIYKRKFRFLAES